ncbi:beta-propeller fold lactonase family protein [Gimesia panareensis]|uniref:beta-propeller fold lactonase family protein n=1 Tax=Gimesia panareensis TaxID=2527978 RepID=UPI0011884F63|nr:beta-propeller fold lactonase family protein [Gimesia panareensis]QDU49206.1 Lactonase, 7-bladed beta-propeller [Gimesia panareensis]
MFLSARSVRFTLPLVLTLLSCLVFTSRQSHAGNSSSLLDISTDGKLLACSNRDSGTVTIVDLDQNKKLRELKVGRHPEGVTFLGDTHQLATAVYDDDLVVFLDADTGKQLGQTEVFDEPYGIVSTSSGDKVYVTLDYPGRIVEINTKNHEVSNEFSVGQHLKGLAISHDDQSLFTTEYYTALVRQTDAKTGRTIDQWEGGSTDNLARQITLHPRRSKAYLPHIRSRITVAHGAGSIFPIVSVIDTKPADGSRRKKIPMDSFQGARVTSNPWDTAITPDGKTFFVVFAGTDDMFVCNVIDDDYRELTFRARLNLGHNPRGVRVSPDGKTFYVYNALDFNIVAYDTQTLQRKATIAVTENPLSDEILLGKRLFYTALQPMSSRLWISCASCHPDGQPDGKTWHNPEGLRNTQSLAGMAWTHPIHWSADRDEVQDFEHTIRGPLMQGRGLVTGRINASLKAPNKGLSRALDAMAAYSNTHKFTLSPYAKKGLNPAAKRGREIFFSQQTKCATCHSGPFYSDSNPTAKIIRHNVGTAVDNPGEKMGPEYDTPTLLGVYRTAPYLSHGKAQTLEEVLTVYNHDDQHGVTSQLSKQERADLVEFLKALPYEDPVPQAQAAGLVKVK